MVSPGDWGANNNFILSSESGEGCGVKRQHNRKESCVLCDRERFELTYYTNRYLNRQVLSTTSSLRCPGIIKW